MSDRMDRMGRALGRAASGATLGHTVRMGPFSSILASEALLDAVSDIGLQSIPRVDIANVDGGLLFMTGFSKTGGADVTG